MLFPQPLLPGRVVERVNRFTLQVTLDAGDTSALPLGAHVANTGNLRSILQPGTPVMVTPAPFPRGKLPYRLVLARQWGRWVAVNSGLASRLLAEAIGEDRLASFRGWRVERSEPAVEDGRLDLLLVRNGRRLWVETKCTTLVRNGVARFPDPATERGRRHLERLISLVRAGEEAALCFVVQRADAHAYRTLDGIDPAFTATLQRARAAGVRCHAYRCFVSRRRTWILDEIPILDPPL